MDWQDRIFWFFALLGSGLFLLQLCVSLLGIIEDDAGGEPGMGDAIRVKWLSKQAIVGFLMLFGWTALACRHEFAFSLPATLLWACIAGAVAMIVSGFLFCSVRRLHSSGTVFNLDAALGKEAMVYQRIPQGGIGKISISIDGHAHEIDAISYNGRPIDSFLQVIVMKKIDNQTLAVSLNPTESDQSKEVL